MDGTNLPVPFVDLKGQTDMIRGELREAMDRVIDDSAFILGPAVSRFESEFASYCRVPECIALNTGTSALHLAMLCVGVRPGDEVITVSMSFIATVWPILYIGARPVLVDIDPDRYTMDPRCLERAITRKTRAIVPVHLYGQCADMDPILRIAADHSIPVIEDCCQAHGAEYQGRRAGSMGAVGCFSFYPSKNLGGFGEGGAMTTHDPEIAVRARRLRDHAQQERYSHVETGYNYRMDGLQGAVLDVKQKYLDPWTEGRRKAAAEYDRLLACTSVTRPVPCPDGRHVYHLYVIRDPQRDALRAHLESHGVGAAVHYPTPIHLQKPLRELGYKEGDLPVTEETARTCLSLPMFPHITPDQIRRVVDVIRAARPRN